MGTVNLSTLYGVASSNPSVSNVNNILDNNLSTYSYKYYSHKSLLESSITVTTYNTVSFTTPVAVESVRVKYGQINFCKVSSIYVTYANDITTRIWTTTSTSAQDVSLSLGQKVYIKNLYLLQQSVLTTFLNVTVQTAHSCFEIQALGPDIPPSTVRMYKDKSYTLGLDVDSVSPLYIGGQRIALGATSDPMATPFRYYDDGDTYAILKAQGT